jgi:hypothetical protein
MAQRFDESDLLAWIEGEMPAAEAALLEARLSAQPALLAQLVAMRDDRRILRAVGEMDDAARAAAPPVDLFAELEPRLARPMLMDEAPGRYRRSHRPARRRRLRRYAAAAGLLIAASGATWLAVQSMTPPPAEGGAIAAAAGEGAEAGRPIVAADQPPAEWPPAGAAVHHRAPSGTPLAPEVHRLVAAGPGEGAALPGAPPDGAAAAIAPFALVIDAKAAEDVLMRALAEGGGDVALVRNFNSAEARELFARARRERDGEDDRRVTGTGAAGRDAAADDEAFARFLASLRADSPGGPSGGAATGATLVGAPALAPSFEEQLDLADRGAVYSIAAPAERLPDLLARLAISLGADTELRMLPAAGPPPAGDWLADHERVQREWEAIKARGGAVVLPVVLSKAR